MRSMHSILSTTQCLIVASQTSPHQTISVCWCSATDQLSSVYMGRTSLLISALGQECFKGMEWLRNCLWNQCPFRRHVFSSRRTAQQRIRRALCNQMCSRSGSAVVFEPEVPSDIICPYCSVSFASLSQLHHYHSCGIMWSNMWLGPGAKSSRREPCSLKPGCVTMDAWELGPPAKPSAKRVALGTERDMMGHGKGCASDCQVVPQELFRHKRTLGCLLCDVHPPQILPLRPSRVQCHEASCGQGQERAVGQV